MCFSKQTQYCLWVLRIATFENIGDRSRIYMRQGRDDLGAAWLISISALPLKTVTKGRAASTSAAGNPARAAIRRRFGKAPAAG